MEANRISSQPMHTDVVFCGASHIKLYDAFVIVEAYPPGKSIGMTIVHPWSEIEQILLEK